MKVWHTLFLFNFIIAYRNFIFLNALHYFYLKSINNETQTDIFLTNLHNIFAIKFQINIQN